MKTLNIEKVATLPATYSPNTEYFVQVPGQPNLVDLYVSSSDGLSVRHIITRSEIVTLISQAISSASGTVVVADITARNALTPSNVTTALVLNATGDSTVASGAATYVYDPSSTTWIKISEAESMDYVVQWSSIQGKPNVTATQIEAAVAASHTHTNMTLLNNLTNVGSALYYLNEPVNGNIVTENW